MINILLIIGIIAQVIDGILTSNIIKRGGREANPLVRWVMDKLGWRTGLWAAKAVATALLGVVWWSGAVWVLLGVVCVYAGVCVWNAKVYQVIRALR